MTRGLTLIPERIISNSVHPINLGINLVTNLVIADAGSNPIPSILFMHHALDANSCTIRN